MGSIYSKGTRDKPKYYLHYKVGTNALGKPQYTMTKADGCLTMAAARKELARIELALAKGEPVRPGMVHRTGIGALLADWLASITNRSAYEDRKIAERDLIPRFGHLSIEHLDVEEIQKWLGELAKGKLSAQSQRHRLNLLSRFFSWCVVWGHSKYNPVKSVPVQVRPKVRKDQKKTLHLSDDSLVPVIMGLLGNDLGLMYYLGRYSGLREGECAGLRMSDLDHLEDGLLFVSKSFHGELKESKNGSKPFKWVPSPIDALEVLGAHIAKRKASGAGLGDLVFPAPKSAKGKPRKGLWADWLGYHPRFIRTEWRKAANQMELSADATFYGFTRHTFSTKALEAGVSLDEVSRAMGHSSPAVTKMYYDHVIKPTYSVGLRSGLSQIAGLESKSAA